MGARRSKPALLHPAEQYCDDVISGKIIACEWVQLACNRHRWDLTHATKRGYRFDEAAAQKALNIYKTVLHTKGKKAGRALELEPWQQFIVWNLFGWLRTVDNTRRFRQAYVSVARKNGKSTMMAPLGLYLAFADGEIGAEVYSAATKREQAKVVWGDARQMTRMSPMLKKHVRVNVGNLSRVATNSKFEPLSSDTSTLDGLNVHGVIADEIHQWRTRDMWDVLETATSARAQPLMIGITTAGSSRESFCYSLHEHTMRVLKGYRGDYFDDAFFGIIFTLDDGDDWEDERVWVKANPNLNVSKDIVQMREKAARAKQMPSALNAFLRLELNVWTQGETKWMDMTAWRENALAPIDLNALTGRIAYAGLDLSSTLDITALVYVFPPQQEADRWVVLPRFWIPEDNMHERIKRDRVPYDVWTRAGLVIPTPGNVIDYEYIFDALDADLKRFKIAEVAFDRWGASRVVQILQGKGLQCVEFGQGYRSMSPPMKELERMVAQRQLDHGNNPVLAWMADNLVAQLDPAGNIKPDKERSREKIDGMVALIMALDRALRNPASAKESVYETRGLRMI